MDSLEVEVQIQGQEKSHLVNEAGSEILEVVLE